MFKKYQKTKNEKKLTVNLYSILFKVVPIKYIQLS